MFNLFRLLETKHRKYFVFEKDAKADIYLVELKFAGEIRKYFVNPKIEVEVFSYIIYSLDFKNIL